MHLLRRINNRHTICFHPAHKLIRNLLKNQLTQVSHLHCLIKFNELHDVTTGHPPLLICNTLLITVQLNHIIKVSIA